MLQVASDGMLYFIFASVVSEKDAACLAIRRVTTGASEGATNLLAVLRGVVSCKKFGF